MRIVKVPGIIGKSASPGVSAAVWFLLFIALYAVSAAHDSLLPERFLLDEAMIFDRMKTVTSFQAFGDSFDNLAWIFKGFGLENFSISLAGFLASTLGMFFAIWRSSVKSLKPAEFVLVAFWLVNQTVYIGIPSKELIISVVVMLLLFYSSSRAILALFVVLAGLVAVYFRSYWAITLVATVFLYLVPKSFRKPLPLVVIALVMFVIVAVVFQTVYGQSLDFARQSANEWRDPNEVGSIIVQFIPGNNMFIGVANVAITLATFVLPLRLITSGSPLQMLGGLGVFLTFWMVLLRYRKATSLFPVGRFEKLCFCFLVSFIATQAIFEPDYGSFLRHLSPVSPMIMFLVLRLESLRKGKAPVAEQRS
ncbi:hypothetical protein BJG93_30380 (plasmid) [Paraburkholderia sprentiae WSM5005]|uniref:Glycosyltransferase RgtA/B/C/D-like domain-containing protein n=1 Tax=Paraburkholderia sprentiae WSM5005 TaxID=754502 RepID=A0A1I9YU63_9BURK|nr:hypothetical protein [Paraburkholderia sprentiae]APA89773.1 hypothetical protein BJG93_30380 [Paraburkholderia sprentiae WSM5005]